MKAFDCDSYIRIENPMAFGQAVARRISGFSGGAEGPTGRRRTTKSSCLGRSLGRLTTRPSF